MKIICFVSILLICFSPQASLLAQKKDSKCELVQSTLYIRECSAKSKTLEKVLDEMINKIEEEEVCGIKIPYLKIIYIDSAKLGITIKMLINDDYLYFDEDLNKDSTLFITHKGVQILIGRIEPEILNDFFEIKANKSSFITYSLVNRENGPCLDPIIIDQRIIYEIRGTKYRFQEKTLTHTELNW